MKKITGVIIISSFVLTGCFGRMKAPQNQNGPADLSVSASPAQPEEVADNSDTFVNRKTNINPGNVNTTGDSVVRRPDGLGIEDLIVGGGETVGAGSQVSIHYRATLQNGTEFDSTYSQEIPYTFPLAKGRVLAGLDQGIIGMKKGGKRRIIIPPELAFGSEGLGTEVPPNATVIYTVELVN